MKTELNNTQRFCLMALAHRDWITPQQIAAARWPQSKQLDKKTVTIAGHLEFLKRRQMVREARGAYALTNIGMNASGLPPELKVVG